MTAGLMTLKQVIETTKFSRTTLWRHIKSGKFPTPDRMGKKKLVWPIEVITDWASKQPGFDLATLQQVEILEAYEPILPFEHDNEI